MSEDRDSQGPTFGGARGARALLEEHGETLVVRLAGELDLDAVDDFTRFMEELEARAPRAVVVDLDGLEFLDSTGARGLVEVHGRAAGRHRFAVLSGSGPAHRLLQVARLDTVLPMIDSLQEISHEG